MPRIEGIIFLFCDRELLQKSPSNIEETTLIMFKCFLNVYTVSSRRKCGCFKMPLRAIAMSVSLQIDQIMC